MRVAKIVTGDIQNILSAVEDKLPQLAGKTVLISGGAGFLGYYLTQTLLAANEKLAQPCKVICLDTFFRGRPDWLVEHENLDIVEADVATFDYEALHIDYIIHAASIASPTYYRKHPIETMDANIQGLRVLLEYAVKHDVQSFLFFSSSEIYGNPPADQIPTREDYNGNVSCTGPRACYDESKRYGETLCVNFWQMHHVPVKVVRPFNNYGPGLPMGDKRVIPDFSAKILAKEDIVMHSDGTPTRTFCYISDAVTGYLLALLSDKNGEVFNIGAEEPEISIRDLAVELLRVAEQEQELKITGLKVLVRASQDKEYLTDNPDKRRPSIDKARKELGYTPAVGLREGLRRSLIWYAEQ